MSARPVLLENVYYLPDGVTVNGDISINYMEISLDYML